MVSASTDKTAKLWSEAGDFLTTLTGHTEAVTSVAALLTPYGLRIVTGSDDSTARLWVIGGECCATLSYDHKAICRRL